MKTENKSNPALSGLGAAPKNYTGKFAEQGTAASGFASDGPYHCEDCVHLQKNVCYHPAVMADKDLPDMPDGTPAEERKQSDGGVLVDAEHECCRYVHPPKDSPKETPKDKE